MSDAGRLTGPFGPLNAPHALASRQHGVFDLAQLIDLGLSASAVRKRVKAGRLHRVHRGVYSLVPPGLLSRDGRFMAAVLACGPGAALSHRSAAALHELRRTDRAGIDVTIPCRTHRTVPGVDVHRSTTLTAADVTLVNNIPVTTIARTLLDLGAVVPRRPLERAVDQAEILELLDTRALDDQLERNRKRPSARNLQRVRDEHAAGSTPTWTELEEAFLSLCRRAGVPKPEVNAWVVLDDGEPAIRPDFVWREQRVVIETG